jgi:parvulin-like peptidyl-prolyl isomerase
LAALTAAALRQLNDLGLLVQCLRAGMIAEAVGPVSVTQEEQNQLVSQYCQQRRIQDQAGLEAHLQQQGRRLPSLLWELTLPLRIQRYAQQQFGAKAEAEFLDCKDTLDQVVYSLLRVRDAELARELYLRIEQQEASFPELAAQYAEGPERQTNGIVGPVPLTQAHPLLAEQLRTHQPGTLIPPFNIEQWWLVVRLERYTPAVFNESTALEMAQKLFNDSLQNEVGRSLRAIQTYLDSTAAA